MYLVAKPGLDVKDAKQLVQMAKAYPGKLSYASAGAGTPPHLAAELFKQQTAISTTHIPYRGAARALQDVMAGHADYLFDPASLFPTSARARSSCSASRARSARRSSPRRRRSPSRASRERSPTSGSASGHQWNAAGGARPAQQ
jgi:tripartite-type tricarboxylate transporter receptor subunit TctC